MHSMALYPCFQLVIHSCNQFAFTPVFFLSSPISVLSSRTLSSFCVPNSHSSFNSSNFQSEELITISQSPPKQFTYNRATPSIRWPHLKHVDASLPQSLITPVLESQPPEFEENSISVPVSASVKAHEGISRTKIKKMNKLALKRANDWRERCSSMIEKIMNLEEHQSVGEVLDDQRMYLSSSDFCHIVKALGEQKWQRALDVYVWLNSMQWYSPNPQMLSTIIAVMGRNNEEEIAAKIFESEEGHYQHTVQVYNAMMSVYARNGNYESVLLLFDRMRKKGMEPDLISFNTLINARLRSSEGMAAGLALNLLKEMKVSGVRPDDVTYSTLISSSARSSNLEETIAIFENMEENQCSPDLSTCHQIISVYNRCGMTTKAENLWKSLKSAGFFADFDSEGIDAFSREGDLEKVKRISDGMAEMVQRRSKY